MTRTEIQFIDQELTSWGGVALLKKMIERILKLRAINLSVDKVLHITKTVTTLKIKLPVSGEMLTKTMLLTEKHHTIKPLFDRNFWENV